MEPQRALIINAAANRPAIEDLRYVFDCSFEMSMVLQSMSIQYNFHHDKRYSTHKSWTEPGVETFDNSFFLQ